MGYNIPGYGIIGAQVLQVTAWLARLSEQSGDLPLVVHSCLLIHLKRQVQKKARGLFFPVVACK